MKKIKVILAAVVLSAFALTSCSSDDDSTPATLIGKWNRTKTVSVIGTSNTTTPYVNNQATCGKDYIEFTAANVLRNVVFNKDAQGVCSEAPGDQGAYTKTNDALTIVGGLYDGTYAISTLSGSELRIVDQGTVGDVDVTTTIYFSRAK